MHKVIWSATSSVYSPVNLMHACVSRFKINTLSSTRYCPLCLRHFFCILLEFLQGSLGVCICTLLASTSIIQHSLSEVHPGSCMYSYPSSTIAEWQSCCVAVLYWVHPFFSHWTFHLAPVRVRLWMKLLCIFWYISWWSQTFISVGCAATSGIVGDRLLAWDF